MAGIPQVITEDRASGAQFIEGTLKFDGRSGGNHGYGHLRRTSSGASGGGTFTISWWAKRGSMRGDWQYMIAGDNGSLWGVGFVGTSGQYDSLTLFNGSHQYSSAKFRDNSGWYHIVLSVDSDDGPRLWVNGELQSNANSNASWNLNNTMYIGKWVDSGTAHNYDGYLAQYTCIDGLELGPSYFAYTDPLTGTWRPKKFRAEGTTVNDGTVWSDSSSDPNSVKHSGNADQLFNGNLSSGGVVLHQRSTSNTAYYVALDGVSIPCNNSVAFYSANGASTATMRINGDDNLKVEATSTTNGWWALNYEGIITKIELGYLDGSGSSNTYYGIQIDGVTLIDSTTQNLAFGNAGFYLPLDGNTPIGKDQSGNGNDWTPVGFGGSVELPKATGAIPVLNTNDAGTVAKGGVRTDKKTYTVTASGGKYYLDGVLTPTLNFLRGGTYIFDYTAASGHPFKFSTTSDGTHNSGSEYTDGTNTSTTNVMKITVPHNAPDTLYYYCSAHSGMGSSINVTTDVLKADPYAWKCVLAMPLVGSSADESKNINCTQSAAKTITSTGNVAASSDRSNFYRGSFEFDGNGDYLQCTSSSDYDMNSDFTAEAWVYPTSHANDYAGIFGFSYDSEGVGWNVLVRSSSGRIHINVDMTHTDVTNSLQLNKWTHLALVRSSGTSKIYIDGIADPTTITDADTTGTPSGKQCYIGSYPGYETAREFTGYIQDVRIYKGVAKYTENFVVGSTAPDVLPDTPSGVSGKSNLTKITEGAVAFDGNGDYLSVPGNTDFQMGTGDFTIECYFNVNGAVPTSCWRAIISLGGHTTDNGITIYAPRASSPVDTVVVILNRVNPTMGSTINVKHGWHHVALVRNSGTTKLYVDGIEQSSISDTNNYDYSGDISIGRDPDCSTPTYYEGFISNVRIVKGTALYTSNFTPPTEPLTNVTNTKLLCCQSTTSAVEAAVKPSNTPILEPFSGAGGAQGGGTTSDYLQVSSSGHSDFSLNGDFTVEWWHYRAAANVNNGFMWTIHDSNTATGLELYWGTGGSALKLYTNGGPNSVTATAATGWHHYAIVRSGNTIKVYYDGTEGGSFTNTNTFSGDVRIGAEYYNGNITGGMNGPMSQFRLVKGTAVYTSNFTAPTTALTAITNTKLLTLQGSTPFTDNSGTSKVITKNGNIFTEIIGGITANGDAVATNFNPFTDDINAIRGQASGYATWNPLSTTGVVSTSGGNLVANTVQNGNGWALSTIPMTSGKYYCEMTFEGEMSHNTNFNYIGIVPTDIAATYGTGLDIFRGLGALAIESNSSKVRASIGTGSGATQSDWNTSIGYDESSTIGIAIDCDTPLVKFYVDGKDVGTYPYTMAANKSWVVFCNDWASGYQDFEKYILNAGQKPFKFPPPDGFQPMNLSTVQPEKVIARPDQYVNAIVYTGSGGTKTVSGLNFKSDLIWQKGRTVTGSFAITGHSWHDTVRGTDGTYYKELASNTQNQENLLNNSLYGGLSDITNNGFTVVDGSDNTYKTFNGNGNGYVAWCWKAGGSKGTFNVDDVGYANASDVNMSVGSLNSSAYNQGMVWSSTVSAASGGFDQAASTAFDGNIQSNGLHTGHSGSNRLRTTDNYIVVTMDLSSSPATVSSQIKVYGGYDSTCSVTVDGTTHTSPSSVIHTFNVSGSLTNMTLRGNGTSGRTYMEGMEIDGKQLVDSNQTPPSAPSVANTGCSVGTKQGFSIVAYDATGSNLTVSHGLSERPGFIILKSKNVSGDWLVWHQSLDGVDRFLKLNDNSVPQSQAGNVFLSVDNHVFGTGNDAGINSGNQEKIAYIWHDVPGLQKFGLWKGNGSANGPFVETGFRPAIILYKDITSTGFWNINDSARTTYNELTRQLYPATSDAENHHNSNRPIDFLSNGFKIRSSNSAINNSGRRYIYAAWAEAPNINLYGAQSNAF